MILDTINLDICVPDNITDEAAQAALQHLERANLARYFSDMGSGLLRGAIVGVFVRPSVPGAADLPVFEEVLEEELTKLGAVRDEPQITHSEEVSDAPNTKATRSNKR